MKDRIFYSTCFGFIFGVFLRSFLNINLYFVLLLGFISFFLLIFFLFLAQNNKSIVFPIFILVFCLGVFYFNLNEMVRPEFLEMKVGKMATLTGQIVDEPNANENSQKLIIEIIEPELKNKEKINILVSYFDFDQEFQYGDRLVFSGVLKRPTNFITEQGKDFDYINYLKKDGIFYVMNSSQIEIVSKNHGSKIKSFLFSVKNKFLEKINLAITSPENLLLGGLILGERSAFADDLRQAFVDTGTIHIIALSGYNVTIVAEWFMSLFVFLPQLGAICMGIVAIFFFVLMTGANSTAIRAGLMAVLALIARATGRNYDVARALVLAGVVMILINPLILVYDVSFQLSFIATFAVIFFAPKMEKYFYWVTKSFGLRDIMTVTTAVYIFVLPFILYKMGNLSLVALPANILILPFIPLTMAFGFLSGLLGIVWFVLAVPFSYSSFLLLHYELSVIDFFANVPFASFSVPNFPLWLTVLIYFYFIYKIFYKNYIKHTIKYHTEADGP